MISSGVCPLDFSHSISLAISLQVISSIFLTSFQIRGFALLALQVYYTGKTV